MGDVDAELRVQCSMLTPSSVRCDPERGARLARPPPCHARGAAKPAERVVPEAVVVGLIEECAVQIEQQRVDAGQFGIRSGAVHESGDIIRTRNECSTEPLVDFHTHSHCSDGVLSPAALVDARGPAAWACSRSPITTPPPARRGPRPRAMRHGIRFVPGVELSWAWLGANDPRRRAARSTSACRTHGVSRRVLVRRQRASRDRRATRMRARLPGRELAAAAAACHAPTRLHLARVLVAARPRAGHAGSLRSPAEPRSAGHVPAEWPASESAMTDCAKAAPSPCWPIHTVIGSRRGSSRTRRRIRSRRRALEASMAGMSPNDADRIASPAAASSCAPRWRPISTTRPAVAPLGRWLS